MGLVGHIARMVEMGMRTKFWLVNLNGRDHMEDLD